MNSNSSASSNSSNNYHQQQQQLFNLSNGSFGNGCQAQLPQQQHPGPFGSSSPLLANMTMTSNGHCASSSSSQQVGGNNSTNSNNNNNGGGAAVSPPLMPMNSGRNNNNNNNAFPNSIASSSLTPSSGHYTQQQQQLPATAIGGTSSGSSVSGVGHHNHHHRYWQRQTLTVMSFNVLARCWEPKGKEEFSFPNRFENIKQEIWHCFCDVIALQEVNPISAFRKEFGGKYDILFASKSSGGSLGVQDLTTLVDDTDDGAAVFIKRGAVDIIAVRHIRVFEPGKNGGVSDVGARQFAIAVLCHHVASKANFIFCGMHMKANWYDPNSKTDHSECFRRVFHAQQVLQQLTSFKHEYGGNLPVVFAGDFNSPPDTATIQFLLDGRVTLTTPASGQPLLVNQPYFRFQSAIHDFCASQGTELEFTILDDTYEEKGWSSVLDYIMYEPAGGNHYNSFGMRVTSILQMPKRAEWGTCAIPKTGSDHIPLAVEFLFL